jgi:hypothetical protein
MNRKGYSERKEGDTKSPSLEIFLSGEESMENGLADEPGIGRRDRLIQFSASHPGALDSVSPFLDARFPSGFAFPSRCPRDEDGTVNALFRRRLYFHDLIPSADLKVATTHRRQAEHPPGEADRTTQEVSRSRDVLNHIRQFRFV